MEQLDCRIVSDCPHVHATALTERHPAATQLPHLEKSMALISLNSAESTCPTEQVGLFRRLLSALTRAREAQAKYRMESQLRDHLPERILRDIGLPKP